jgi:hypothetical protein
MEKRLTSIQKEFREAIHQKSQKENDKFDLIFGILSELQSRQAQLEELVGGLTMQAGSGMVTGMGSMSSGSMGGMVMGSGMGSSSSSMGNGMAQQFGNGGGAPQFYGQMGDQMAGGMGVQQPMQQYGGMQPMQPINSDGSQPMMAMQQVMVVASPTGGTMVPQMQMQPGMGQPSSSFSQEQPAPPSRGVLEVAADSAPAAASSEDPSIVAASAGDAMAPGSDGGAPASQDQAAHDPGGSSSSKAAWDKVRKWRVTDLPEEELVPLVSVFEPFGPGIGRQPSDDIVLKWLETGDVVRQTGHSKKIKGYMVMPVKLVGSSPDEEEVEGFVTRRSNDKARDNGEAVWFEEVDGDRDDRLERSERWKPGRAPRD